MLKTSLTAAAIVAAMATSFVVGQANADQPKMHDALSNLKEARADLLSASNDKGGHRQRALANVNAAINQVEAGIRFDRRH